MSQLMMAGSLRQKPMSIRDLSAVQKQKGGTVYILAVFCLTWSGSWQPTVCLHCPQGTMPQCLAAVIVGRDVFLVGAAFAGRAQQLGWQRVPLSAFFRVAAVSPSGKVDFILSQIIRSSFRQT